VDLARGLLARLRSIFSVVEPTRAQVGVYGRELRQLLILACNEVESGWRAVLKANGSTEDRFRTEDYVRLSEPLKLETYVLHLTLYPGYGEISPFAGWTAGRATQSIPWYDAYNSTKHNREGALDAASLQHVVISVAAALVMIEAQFGPDPMGRAAVTPDDFTFVRRPEWLADAYVRPLLHPDDPPTLGWPHEWVPQALFAGVAS
jgi:hypothetical protein